jgi:hypothetical protein
VIKVFGKTFALPFSLFFWDFVPNDTTKWFEEFDVLFL